MQPSISELAIYPLKLCLLLLFQSRTKWVSKKGWALETTVSKSEQRGMMKTCKEAEKPLSGSILSLPEKVKSQGECQPMHRQMNGGALLRNLSDCKQAIIKSLWWQSSVLKGTNKNKYIKHNKSQGPVVETYYPWGITGLFSSGLPAIGS